MTVPFASPQPAQIRATTRVDLLGAVAYLLGFHPDPTGDLVVLGLAGAAVVVTARTDLPSRSDAAGRAIAEAMADQPNLDAAIVIGYGPRDHEPDITALASELAGVGLAVREVLRVAEGRYVCLLCDNCVPAGGATFEVAATVTAVQATVAGIVALPTRQAVAARVARVAEADEAMPEAIATVGERLMAQRPDTDRLIELLDDLLHNAETGARLHDEAAAMLILLLMHTPCRDRAWLASDGLAWQVDLWCDLTRRCPDDFVAPVASLAAWSAWRSGDTVTARAALDRAVAADPAYPMAGLLSDILDRLLSPAAVAWPPPTPPGGQPAGGRYPDGRVR